MDSLGQSTTGTINPGGTSFPLRENRESMETTKAMESSGLGHSVEGADDTVRPVVDQVAARAHRAVDTLAEAATRAAATLEEKRRRLGGMQSHLTERCCDEVRARPLASVGLAAGVGFLLGSLMTRH